MKTLYRKSKRQYYALRQYRKQKGGVSFNLQAQLRDPPVLNDFDQEDPRRPGQLGYPWPPGVDIVVLKNLSYTDEYNRLIRRWVHIPLPVYRIILTQFIRPKLDGALADNATAIGGLGNAFRDWFQVQRRRWDRTKERRLNAIRAELAADNSREAALRPEINALEEDKLVHDTFKGFAEDYDFTSAVTNKILLEQGVLVPDPDLPTITINGREIQPSSDAYDLAVDIVANQGADFQGPLTWNEVRNIAVRVLGTALPQLPQNPTPQQALQREMRIGTFASNLRALGISYRNERNRLVEPLPPEPPQPVQHQRQPLTNDRKNFIRQQVRLTVPAAATARAPGWPETYRLTAGEKRAVLVQQYGIADVDRITIAELNEMEAEFANAPPDAGVGAHAQQAPQQPPQQPPRAAMTPQEQENELNRLRDQLSDADIQALRSFQVEYL